MAIDWQSLDFSYRDTAGHVRYVWKDGQWSKGRLYRKPIMPMHVAATSLHYGQSVFEGLKAFTCRDGKVRVFRLDENVRRMAMSARRLMMPEVPDRIFREAVFQAIKLNHEYVPPYGTGGALYIRPLLFGAGPRIGVQPADEYVFLVIVLPVGNYYKGGLQPVSAVVFDDYDRAAPLGIGHVKAAGNYAIDMEPHHRAKTLGCPITLYLDAREHRFIDEFNTSNFIAISGAGDEYLTPDSRSALPSITNKTLSQLAADEGLKVTRRPIEFEEVPRFSEVAACGTAVVITPVNRILRGAQVIEIGPRQGCGPVFSKLYNKVRAIQVGDLPDTHGWTCAVPL